MQMPLDHFAKPESIPACAARLCDLGYWPVPIPAGCKGPTIEGWPALRMTAETAPRFFNEPGMLVGILHTNVLALDIDVYDADLSRQIVAEALKRFPNALERIGEAPKSALFFRLEAPGFKVQSTPRFEKDDITAQIEVRSVSRQIVAYGRHPVTHRPYTWPRGELWATPWQDLPEARQDEIEQFRDWCEALLRRWAGIGDPKVIDLGLYTKRAFDTGDRPTADQFIDYLGHIPSNLAHDEWVRVLMGIHDFFAGSAEGFTAACDWSSDYPNYSLHEMETKWRSFEPGKGVSYRTVLHLAKQNGADLRRKPAFTIDTGTSERPHGGDSRSAGEETGDSQDAAQEPAEGALEWYRDIKPFLTSSYVIKGVLDLHALSAIYGPSNSGKTFFALDMAFHIATGRAWRGYKIRPAAVLYLAAEGGRGVQNRIAALKKHTGVADAPIALRRAGLDLLRNQADIQAIYDLAEEAKREACNDNIVIVVDTLSRAMAGGDENSPVDMTALIRNVDLIREATKAHVMLVHHTGKDAARGARGHSSLRAALDTEIEVQSEDGWRAAVVTKQRDNESGQEFPFTLESVFLGYDEDGGDVTSCVVAETDEATSDRPKKLTKNQRVLAETFDLLAAEGIGHASNGGPMMPPGGQFWLLPMDEFRAACEGKMTAKNTRDAFLSAFDAMNRPGGMFCMASGFVWRTDKRINR